MDRILKLQQLMENGEADSFVRHALALEYIKAGNDEKATELFSALLKDEPSYLGSYYHLGKALERLGRSDEAIEVFRKGMDLATANGDSRTLNELRAACEDAEV